MNKKITRETSLQPENMIYLYSQGAFPMADDDGIIDWYMPEERCIIPISSYNIPRSLRKFMSNSDFEYRFDTSFIDVVNNCAARDKTWITDELIEAYLRIKERGFVHTVEVWQNNKLVGGLYGISIRGAFFGESMFSKVPQASKCALAKLLERAKEKDFVFVDVQYPTEHLAMFGTQMMDLNEYRELLIEAYSRNTTI